MAGFTPVFDTVFDGTLCGKWPTLPVWLTLLPMADKYGCIDMTYQAISARSGWPLDLLKQAISELMEPDPESRTAAADGRRLELIDPDNRHWGWRVVNHRSYRERARKQSAQAEATATGADAARKSKERENSECPALSGAVQSSPAPSGPQTSNADSDANSKTQRESAPKSRRTRRVPESFEPDQQFALRELPDLDVAREILKFRNHEFANMRSDWTAVWANWVARARDRGDYSRTGATGKTQWE